MRIRTFAYTYTKRAVLEKPKASTELGTKLEEEEEEEFYKLRPANEG